MFLLTMISEFFFKKTGTYCTVWIVSLRLAFKKGLSTGDFSIRNTLYPGAYFLGGAYFQEGAYYPDYIQ